MKNNSTDKKVAFVNSDRPPETLCFLRFLLFPSASLQLRCSTFMLIVGLVFSSSLILSNTSFAQTMTPKSTVTLSKNSNLVQSQAGFYRMTVGDVNVTALSDGTVGLQILDGLLLNAKSGEVQKLLAYNY